MNPLPKKDGLTLVELLIVIAIIGLLASIFTINISKWRARTRDSQRVADIKTVQQGLAFYFFRSEYHGSYPIEEIYIIGNDNLSVELLSTGAISTIPIDPINEGNYRYHYCSLQACTGESDGTSYILTYYLETGAISGQSQGQNTVGP